MIPNVKKIFSPRLFFATKEVQCNLSSDKSKCMRWKNINKSKQLSANALQLQGLIAQFKVDEESVYDGGKRLEYLQEQKRAEETTDITLKDNAA